MLLTYVLGNYDDLLIKVQLLLLDNQTRTNMLNNAPGPSNALHLVPNPKPLNLELWLLCQNVKESAGSSKLTSAVAVRQTILSTSNKFEDGLVTSIDQNRLVDIRYHVTSCYTTYKKKRARHEVEKPKQILKNPIFHTNVSGYPTKEIQNNKSLDPTTFVTMLNTKEIRKDFGSSPQG